MDFDIIVPNKISHTQKTSISFIYVEFQGKGHEYKVGVLRKGNEEEYQVCVNIEHIT